MNICIVPDCTNECNRKYCFDHQIGHQCFAPNCKTRTHSRYCAKHNGRLHRGGSLELPTMLSSRVCVQCGADFQRHYPKDKYCSLRCYVLAHIGQPEGPKGCWPWLLKPNRNGYGIGCYRKVLDLAHRLSFRLFRGEIGEEAFVLHTCDNPICVNPNHLFLGNHADNMADMRRKNRAHRPTGTANGQSKLSPQQVLEIYNSKLPRSQLARQYQISIRLVTKIWEGELWSRVTGHKDNSQVQSRQSAQSCQAREGRANSKPSSGAEHPSASAMWATL